MARKALLVIDMLHDFMDPAGALYCGDRAAAIIPRVAELLASHRREGSVIIFVADQHDPDDKEFALFPPHAVAGTPGGRLLPGFAVGAGEHFVPKKRYSALFGTELEAILARQGVDEIHLSGVCTSICVMETCSDLRDRDQRVIVHTEAVADFDPQAHAFALKRMQNILGCRLEP